MYAKNIWKNASPEKVTAIMDFNEGYKEYISLGKTERLCVDETIKIAEENVNFETADMNKLEETKIFSPCIVLQLEYLVPFEISSSLFLK